MFDDIHEIRKMRKRYNGKMYVSGIPTFRALADVEEQALQDGAIAQKNKELIALGISISHGCYG